MSERRLGEPMAPLLSEDDIQEWLDEKNPAELVGLVHTLHQQARLDVQLGIRYNPCPASVPAPAACPLGLSHCLMHTGAPRQAFSDLKWLN